MFKVYVFYSCLITRVKYYNVITTVLTHFVFAMNINISFKHEGTCISYKLSGLINSYFVKLKPQGLFVMFLMFLWYYYIELFVGVLFRFFTSCQKLATATNLRSILTFTRCKSMTCSQNLTHMKTFMISAEFIRLDTMSILAFYIFLFHFPT